MLLDISSSDSTSASASERHSNHESKEIHRSHFTRIPRIVKVSYFIISCVTDMQACCSTEHISHQCHAAYRYQPWSEAFAPARRKRVAQHKSSHNSIWTKVNCFYNFLIGSENLQILLGSSRYGMEAC